MSYTEYALLDPRDYSTRYIGKTENVIARFIQHLQCRETNARKNAWIQELADLGLVPVMKTLETGITNRELAIKREGYWMQHYRYLGADLINAAMPATEITIDQCVTTPTPEPVKLIGLPMRDAAKLPEMVRAGKTLADLRKAVKKREIKPKSDGSISRMSVETWLKK